MGELALLIPLAPFLLGGFVIWTRHERRMAETRQNAGPDDSALAMAARTAELEERVRVLERIVTDKGYDVASQIEALRDARRIEAMLDSREPGVRP